MPLLPGLPFLDHTRLPGEALLVKAETKVLAVGGDHAFGVGLEVVGVHNRRRLAGHLEDAVKEARLGVVADLLTSDTVVDGVVRDNALCRVTHQESVVHAADEVLVLHDVVKAVEGHVLEVGAGLALGRRIGVEDHVAHVRVGGRVVGIHVEERHLGTGLMHIVHVAKGLVENLEITAFHHDAFEGSRARARVNPQHGRTGRLGRHSGALLE
mmetsp:Transcript_51521/g.129253  ORF Transcript_51521/g.129253 Transcript_51521/m.129253 type:complete len:212 (-) Transcript_51521:338-973(-)